jgi:hypothetical protein
MLAIKASSTPAGATIVVDGKPRGVTPSTIMLPGGTASTIELTKEGFESDRQRITPRQNHQSLHVVLKRKPRRPWSPSAPDDGAASRFMPVGPPCDHEALAEKGREHHAAGQNAAAYEAFEKAYQCTSDPQYAEKAIICACNVPNVEKAKLQWKRLPTMMRQRALMICVRNGIQEDVLNAP